MNFYSNLPNISISQFDGEINLYDVNKNSDIYLKKNDGKNFSNFLNKVGELSPYLKRISKDEKKWLNTVKDKNLNQILNDLISDKKLTYKRDIVQGCRLIKKRSFLITSIYDISGYISLDQVSSILTCISDHIVTLLSNHVIYLRGKDEKELDLKMNKKNSFSFFIIAMGKMGSFELNYSSDIDIILFFNFNYTNIKDHFAAKQFIINKFKKLVKILTNFSEGDFLYRVDLRLRPDPSSTPIAIDTKFAENYYQKLGRTWERMAFIKARPVCGDIKKGKEFLKKLDSFIWRNHFDYAAIDEVKNLREKMKLNSPYLKLYDLSGYNIKTGLGGIRDIELFTQTYQLIVAGRNRELRGAKTVKTLNKLKELGWLDHEPFEKLVRAYNFFRTIENRLQIVNNTQNQNIPNESSPQFNQLATLAGFASCSKFKDLVLQNLKNVKLITDDFFSNFKFRNVQKKNFLDTEIIKSNEGKLGFKLSNENLFYSKISQLKQLSIFKNESALRSFNALIPKISNEIIQFNDQNFVIDKFEVFLKKLSSGSQIFPLLENNPSSIKILLIVLNSSSLISDQLSNDVKLFDLFISKNFMDSISSKETMNNELKIRIGRNNDFEFIINELRRFVKERKFQISIHLILGKINCFTASIFFTDTAEACVNILIPVIKQNLKKRYGYPSNHLPAILGMGKLGSSEMNFYSDLDLILIYDHNVIYRIKNDKYSSLETYFARYTQALVSAFTSLTEEGKLYDVDMRLRPSGRKGPVATSLSSFLDYQLKKAWVWEHMALSRGRIIAGDTNTKNKLNRILIKVFDKKIFLQKEIKKQTKNMRLSLQNNYSKKFEPENIKYGRGGFQELELLVQMGMLLMNIGYRKNNQSPKKLISCLYKVGFFDKEEYKNITEIYELFFYYQQVSCIMFFETDQKKILSSHGVDYLIKNLSKSVYYNKEMNLNDLNLLLKQKSQYIGKLFDRKLE